MLNLMGNGGPVIWILLACGLFALGVAVMAFVSVRYKNELQNA